MVSLSTSAKYYSISSSTTFATTTSRLVSVSTVSAAATTRWRSIRVRAFINKPSSTNVVQTTLRLLDWDKLSDSIASFAGTSFGREAIKEQLWNLNRTYSESVKLLEETNAAVEMHNYGACLMDFTSLRMELVKSAIQQARRSLPVTGSEAIAILALLQFAESLQFNLKSAIKEDADWLQRFMPVADVILELVISRPLMKLIPQLIDEDGAVKDSASPALKRSRDQVRSLERKLYQLMDSLVRNEQTSLEVSNVGGRWCCIQSGADMQTSFEGLLLSSGLSSGSGSILEPLAAVPLNDELQQAKASVTQAESDVLLSITNKMQVDLDDVENLFRNIVLLDVINARARYGLSYGGTYPDLYLPEDALSTSSVTSLRKWKLYLPKAFHPLLLQQHRQALQEAIENANNATNEIRRRRQQGQSAVEIEEANSSVSSLQMEVARLKESPPIPFDIFVGEKTRVVVISGPNTGGKTICLKTLGLAALMAKSGVYVLSSEPVKIPWFDSVFADIGDEQSLSQSLSTFSAHLKQTGEILSHSTTQSLVLLDEVGAGTNPVEGAGLGMSLLESFAESGVLLTMATTHHGELKTLKYSNNAFENACMEFDEVKLKPTYKILWGVPGRSNAMNIAERLGVPGVILKNARELYGDASAEINEVIVEMEKFKREIEEHAYESQRYLKVSREAYKSVVGGKRMVMEHGRKERYKKFNEISESASGARSFLHNKLRQLRATAATAPTPTAAATQQTTTTTTGGANGSEILQVPTNSTTQTITNPPPSSATAGGVGGGVPQVGDTVHVTSLNKKATVIKVEPSKQQIMVQVGFMRLKLNLADVLA